jgi:hypothetical protein
VEHDERQLTRSFPHMVSEEDNKLIDTFDSKCVLKMQNFSTM